MRAILLAAGVGSRISRFTKKPKSTLEVDGEPLIRRTVDILLSHNIEVAIVVGFKKEEIKDLLKNRDITIFENPFYRITNSISSLWFAREFIEGDVLIANADVFFDERILDELLNDNKDVVMLTDKSTVNQGDYFFKLDNGTVSKYGKELDKADRDTEYVGLAKISSGFTKTFIKNLNELIDKEEYNLWWENVLYEYSSKYPIYIKDVSEYFWAEIDYIDDYLRIKEYIKTKQVSSKINNKIDGQV